MNKTASPEALLVGRIMTAAFDVAHFSKTHEYPKVGEPEFFEFTQLLDNLATAINAAYPAFNRNVKAIADGKRGIPCDGFEASDYENTMCDRCGLLQRDHKTT